MKVINSRIPTIWRALTAVAILAGVNMGCVSLDEYRQLEFAQRNCEAERERLVGDLANAKVQTRDQQSRLDELASRVTNKDDQIKALEGRLRLGQETLDRMTEIYEKLADRPIPTGEVIMLPAELDTALKDFAAKYPNMVQYDASRGVVKFGSDVLFDLGSDQVRADASEGLTALAEIIGSPAAAAFDAVVVGHTDNIRIAKPETRAKHPTNWHLSVHRAIAVMNILAGAGVASERMGVMGYGQFRPAVPNDTRANREKNRRVEVYLVAKRGASQQASKAKATPTVEK